MAQQVLRTANWEELLKLAGSKNVRYVKDIDGFHAYQNIHDSAAPLVVYEKK